MRWVQLAAITICLAGCDRSSTPIDDVAQGSVGRETVTTVIQNIANEFETHYVVPAEGKRVAERLRTQLARGEWHAGTSPETFARTLTSDLREQTHDVHITVVYGDTRAPHPVFGAATRNEMVNSSGFERVDRLRGNIGYIRLQVFSRLQRFKPSVDAAMSLLADTDALIIDLRNTPGGDAGSAAYFCSFFLAPGQPIDLNTFVDREGHATQLRSSTVPTPYIKKPVYILTSRFTGSAAEDFSFQMKELKIAQLVGKKTAGAGRSGRFVPLGHDFRLFVSTAQTQSPRTEKGWEGVGITPDIHTESKQALAIAVMDYLEHVSPSTNTAWTYVLRQLHTDVQQQGESAVLRAYSGPVP